MNISFSNLALPKESIAVFIVDEKYKNNKLLYDLDTLVDGFVISAMVDHDFSASDEEILSIYLPKDKNNIKKAVIFGVKDADKRKDIYFTRLGGRIFEAFNNKKAKQISIVIDGNVLAKNDDAGEVAASIGFGIGLREYEFKKYKSKNKSSKDSDTYQKNDLEKSKKSDKKLEKVNIYTSSPNEAKKAYQEHSCTEKGIYFARDLVNEPSNVLTPVRFAKECKKLEKIGVGVDVLNQKTMKKLGMRTLLGVGQGSKNPSRCIIMRWDGAKKSDDKQVILVGKGVTFDTGGISLKPPRGMEDMKGDMAGAAAVCGAMKALALRNANANVIGIIGRVENMPGSNAQRPGDIVKTMSGKTVEVLNTDAEGRLVLADLLYYAHTYYNPKVIVNLATLTGAIIISLGHEYAGLFSNSDELSEQLYIAGIAENEKVWRLPLHENYDNLMDSKNADIQNIGSKPVAGSITAAQFLQRFVDEHDWAHIDIAGVGHDGVKSEINQSWGSGFGVRLLNRFVKDNYEI